MQIYWNWKPKPSGNPLKLKGPALENQWKSIEIEGPSHFFFCYSICSFSSTLCFALSFSVRARFLFLCMCLCLFVFQFLFLCTFVSFCLLFFRFLFFFLLLVVFLFLVLFLFLLFLLLFPSPPPEEESDTVCLSLTCISESMTIRVGASDFPKQRIWRFRCFLYQRTSNQQIQITNNKHKQLPYNSVPPMEHPCGIPRPAPCIPEPIDSVMFPLGGRR